MSPPKGHTLLLFFLTLITATVISTFISIIGLKIIKQSSLVTNLFQQPDKNILSDKEIIRTIVNETPSLKYPNTLTDFEIANAIREWAFKNVPVVFYNAELRVEDKEKVSSAYRVPLGKRILMFREGEAGAWCSATATTLSDIFNLFGFESYTIDIGDIYNNEKKATHSLTLVKIRHEGKEILSAQDAYLNYTVIDSTGSPLDYFDILALLKKQEEDQVVFQYGAEQQKPRLVAKNTTEKINPEKTYANGNMLVRENFSLPDFEASAKDFLLRRELPQNLIFLNMFPYNSHGNNRQEAESILNKARAITGSWCYSSGECLGL